jgi:outer membrane receptor protein involved in Fe transport
LGPGWTTGSANLHEFSTIPHISGEYNVWEYFGELNSQLWRAASGPQSLGASLAYRSSTYSSLEDPIDSWKIGLDFEVTDDLRVRATKSRDVREATLADRFDAQSTGANFNDPRFGGQIVATTITRGGNPDLIPEKADSLVFGFIYQPGWLEGLRVSVDWYDIKISDSIGTLGVQRIVDECEINKVQSLCKQIVTGVAGRVFDVPLNVAQAMVNGFDYEVSYSMEPDFLSSRSETLKIRAFAGYVGERVDVAYGAATGPEQSGSLGMPDLTGSITAVYTIDAYSFQLQQNYTAPTILNFLWTEGVDVDKNTVASGNYTNMRLGYEGELSSGAAWNLGFNVTNLFDRDPPIIAGFGTRGGGQQVGDYEAYGRLYQLSLNMNF